MILKVLSICLVFTIRFEISNAVLKCYQCETNVGDCIDGQCQDTWCVAVITENQASNTRSVKKMCSKTNPAGSATDSCTKLVNGQLTIQTCVCQLEEFCNSEAGLTRLMNENGAPNSGNNTGNAPVLIQPGSPISPFSGGSNRAPFVPSDPNASPSDNAQPVPIGSNIQGGGGGSALGGQGGQPQQPAIAGQAPPFQAAQEPTTPAIDANNTNPLLPQFPPQPNPNFNQPQVPNLNPGGSNPNIVGGNLPPFSSNTVRPPVPELEPNGTLWRSTTYNPNSVNSADVNSVFDKGDKYSCMCQGPTYCNKDGKCKGDYCAFIEYSPLDIAHSPGAPPVQSKGPVMHLGCASSSEVASSNSQRSFPILQYEIMDSEGKKSFVKANERVCTGNFCNSSAMKNFAAAFSLVVSAIFLFLAR